MADFKVIEKAKKALPDSEQLARLLYEVQRNALVWNHFAGSLIDGWYPGRNKQMGGQFEGSDRERLDQLFKIRDIEARRIHQIFEEIGINADKSCPDYSAIYEELSAATGITATSHVPI